MNKSKFLASRSRVTNKPTNTLSVGIRSRDKLLVAEICQYRCGNARTNVVYKQVIVIGCKVRYDSTYYSEFHMQLPISFKDQKMKVRLKKIK